MFITIPCTCIRSWPICSFPYYHHIIRISCCICWSSTRITWHLFCICCTDCSIPCIVCITCESTYISIVCPWYFWCPCTSIPCLCKVSMSCFLCCIRWYTSSTCLCSCICCTDCSIPCIICFTSEWTFYTTIITICICMSCRSPSTSIPCLCKVFICPCRMCW